MKLKTFMRMPRREVGEKMRNGQTAFVHCKVQKESSSSISTIFSQIDEFKVDLAKRYASLDSSGRLGVGVANRQKNRGLREPSSVEERRIRMCFQR